MFPEALYSVNKNLRLYVGLTVLTLSCCASQAQQSISSELKNQIESEVHLIQVATDEHLPNERIGYLWAVLAVDYRKAGDFAAAENAYVKALALQRDIPSARRNYATTLDNMGTLYLLYGRLEEAERYNKIGAKVREAMGYPLDLARSEEHLAEIDLAKHRFKQSESEAAEALGVMRAQNDQEPLDMIGALNALAFTRCMRGKCAEGMKAAGEAYDLAQRSFGANSMAAAHAKMAVGFASWKSGMLDDADRTMRSAIETMRVQDEPAGRSLLLALMEYRNYLKEERRDVDAVVVERELATTKLQLSNYCAACVNAGSLSGKPR
jgi:tetratricopeptide (TPR) repeat protein